MRLHVETGSSELFFVRRSCHLSQQLGQKYTAVLHFGLHTRYIAPTLNGKVDNHIQEAMYYMFNNITNTFKESIPNWQMKLNS